MNNSSWVTQCLHDVLTYRVAMLAGLEALHGLNITGSLTLWLTSPLQLLKLTWEATKTSAMFLI